MKKYNGDIKITSSNYKEWNKKLKGVEHITGSLTVYSQTKLDAPALTSIRGSLYLNSQAKLDAPALTSIGGFLIVYSQTKLDAPALTSVGGFLTVYSQTKLDAPALTSVGGFLTVYSPVTLDALTSVGGSLSIYSQAKLEALKSVGGKPFTTKDIQWYWHIHHKILVEMLTEPLQNRIDYIKKNKPSHEVALRLKFIKKVQGVLPKTQEGILALHKKECGCKFKMSIFDKKESK